MFYNKKYVISDYLNYTELNELIDKEKELIDEMSMKKIKNDEYVYVNGEQEEAGSNYSLLGDTQQASTPTPTNPVEVQTVTGRQDVIVNGRNYFNNAKQKTQGSIVSEETIPTGKRLTYTSATSSSTTQFLIYAVMDLTKYVGKTVRFKTDWIASASNKGRFVLGLCNADGSNRSVKATISTSGYTGSFVVPSLNGNQTYLLINLYVNTEQGTVNQNDYVDFTDMILTIDDDDMTYEAYNGNTYEINLGKNLIDTSKFENKNNTNITQISTGVRATFVGSQGTYRWAYYKIPNSTDFFGKTCTITANIYNSASNKGSIRVWQLDSNNNAIGNQIGTALNSSGSVTITFPSSFSSGAVSFGLLFYSNVDGTLTNGDYVDYTNLQFEIGSFSTSYSTYFTPIELCKISNYQDKIIKSNGKWYLYKVIDKIVLNGSENWVKSGSTAIDRFFIELENGTLSNYNIVTAYSNRFYYSTNTLAGTIQLGDYQGNTRLFLDYSTYGTTTLQQFETWLSTNNTEVYYVLTSPTTTEITDTTLLSQLESAWKSIKYWNYMEILPAENYDLDLPVYSLDDFLFLEDIDKIEKNVMQIGYDFFQPSGYIQNKIWIKNATILGYENTSNNFGAEDLNRIITDMNILYEHKDDTPTIYNLFANENWDEESLLEWE